MMREDSEGYECNLRSGQTSTCLGFAANVRAAKAENFAQQIFLLSNIAAKIVLVSNLYLLWNWVPLVHL